jgi:hypothetical protein
VMTRCLAIEMGRVHHARQMRLDQGRRRGLKSSSSEHIQYNILVKG